MRFIHTFTSRCLLAATTSIWAMTFLGCQAAPQILQDQNAERKSIRKQGRYMNIKEILDAVRGHDRATLN